ncbi:MAG: PAS domain-containing protein [Gammaproteobacteria bacterium]|nr:PAS domain-containing protein [Gammaproteobacteria bacterium]
MDHALPLDQQLLLKHIPGMVYRCRNDDNWTMLFVSNACEALTGYSPDDLIDNKRVSYASLIHPEDRDMVRREVTVGVRARRAFHCTYRLITRDRLVRWVREQGEAVRTDERGALVLQGYITDITEEKSTEIALAESQASFTQLADSMPLIVWTADANGVTEYTNRAFAEFTGLDRQPLQNSVERWVSAIHPDDRAKVTAAWRVANQTGSDYQQEYRLHSPDGSYRWYLSQALPIRNRHGDILKWYGATIDVHDQRLLLQDARRLANRLINTLESITDAFFTVDKDWKFTYLNAKAEELLGVKRNNMLGRVVWAEFPGAEVFESHYRQAVAEHSTQEFSAEYAPLGKTFHVHAYPSGEGLAVYFRDITSDLAMEEGLLRAQHLEAMGQLTGGVAHDFNNLLTVILGNAELLEELLATQPELRSLAGMIRKAADSGAELTRRLLAFARRQALEPQLIDIADLVTNMESLLRRTLHEDIDIQLIHGSQALAVVDPVELESVLLNLCVNARDAMPGGGCLTIETGLRYLDEEYAAEHADVAPGLYVMMAVSDTGCGIAPNVLRRVYEPFFTTKGPGTGTGLGLSMAYGFVKQSRGHINIYSEPGDGTTVTIYLPQKSGVPQLTQEPEATLQGGTESVLLVEDDELVRDYTARLLRNLGYEVTQASDGRDGLDKLRGREHFDLLLTDVIMPGGLNGPQLAKAARQARPGLKVLYMSGYTENAVIRHGHLDADSPMLNKPFQRIELARKVRTALDCD